MMKGAGAGIRFYLIPDFKQMAEIGIGNVIFRGYEPGILYIINRYRSYADLWKLYGKRPDYSERL